MDILQGVNYLYTSNGQQVGPVEGAHLVQLAQQGHVTATDHIWTEGMAEWVPATTFNQLASLYQAQQQQLRAQAQVQQASLSPPIGGGGAPTVTRRGNSSRTGGSRGRSTLGTLPARRQFQAARKGASANLIYTLFFLPIILFLIPMGFGMLAASGGQQPSDEAAGILGITALICIVAGYICLIAYGVVTYVYLYRAWYYIQDIPGLARTTPGAAVGMLFIPFFNLYWIFNVFPGWATDYNRYLDAKGATTVPRASNGLAIAAMLIPLAHPFMMADMCKGINNLANPIDRALQGE